MALYTCRTCLTMIIFLIFFKCFLYQNNQVIVVSKKIDGSQTEAANSTIWGVWSKPALHEKFPEITSVMSWRYINKIELNWKKYKWQKQGLSQSLIYLTPWQYYSSCLYPTEPSNYETCSSHIQSVITSKIEVRQTKGAPRSIKMNLLHYQ